ncbi:MAG: DUF1015 domain-containing protein [Bacteroidetes bacterium]|nr:DUF1015 domain-containing protein [Bacteroidota bacterium]MCL5738046.1 DUF1015 domain-containing protein [Bacteroidota bacterium]
MADIRPFKAIYFNTSLTDLSRVVAPPYDVIDKSLQDELYKRSPNNIVRLDLNRESNPYPAAAAEMQRMLKEKVLVPDSEASIYPYFQTFKTQDGPKVDDSRRVGLRPRRGSTTPYGIVDRLVESSTTRRDPDLRRDKTVTRRGFVSWIKLEPFEAGVVLPHERTLSKPKEDRLNLMISTKATFSQIFSLYGDQNKTLEKEYDKLKSTKSYLEADYDGVNNKIYRINDSATIKTFQNLLSKLAVYIADGHHRYETALEYQRLMREKNPKHTGEEPYNFIMMYFTNIFDEGLVVYPTHRIIHSLSNFDSNKLVETVKTFFELTPKSDVNALASSLNSAGDYSFGMILPQKKYLLMKLKNSADILSVVKENVPAPVKRLDVTLLHDYVLRQTLGISKEAQEKKLNINYTIDRHEVDNAIQLGKAHVGFILNSTKVEQVREVADAGAVMPQKSTYFYPKLLSGVLLNGLE